MNTHRIETLAAKAGYTIKTRRIRGVIYWQVGEEDQSHLWFSERPEREIKEEDIVEAMTFELGEHNDPTH